MTGNDLMAFGAMSAIQSRGLRVGYDIAVGGFDDVPSAAHIHPGLTTVRQPIYEIGQQLTEMLFQLIAGQDVAERTILLKPQLIIRASSDPSRPILPG
jgi:LacI family transcriptional regulator